MKLSTDTLTVLQNFASINSNLEFKKGKKISTISTGKTVLATATIPDDFPQDFCVHDLNQFLITYNLRKDNELNFDDKNVYFKTPGKSTTFHKAVKSQIVTPPDKQLTLPSIEVQCVIKEDDLAETIKAANILKSPHIAIESNKDNTKIMLSCFDGKDTSSNQNSIEVADYEGKEFTFVFLTENLKLIPGEYQFKASSKGLASFQNTKVDIHYFIALEDKFSTFEDKGIKK